MTLEKTYVVKVVKYNFGEPFRSSKVEFNTYPTEEQIKMVVVQFNELNQKFTHYETTAHIEEYYKVNL